jgi:nicotinamide-nucleotide amidase
MGMNIEVLNTGTELLLGNTINTHGGWFGRQLFGMGLRIARQSTVPDGEAIRDAFLEMLPRADVILITGGLGPTSDDLTREIVAESLGLELHQDEQALRNLESFFAIRNKPMVPANLRQAMVPTGADVLPNPNGTAPGLYIPPRINGRSNCAVFLLPGPPRELYPMFHNEVAPRIRALSGATEINLVSELKFTGIGESDFHHGVDATLAAIPGLEYGYCARIGELDLRLIGSPEMIESARNIALASFSDYLISDDGSSLEATVLRLLQETSSTLAIAESCTGGLIANRITNIPGASEHFTHGWVTYSNAAKSSELGVSVELIAEHGAVSEEVAIAMAQGAFRKSGASFGLSVTGIAGPSGGTEEKPTGTAWLALSSVSGTVAQKVFHPRARKDFKQAVSQSALDLLRRKLALMKS